MQGNESQILKTSKHEDEGCSNKLCSFVQTFAIVAQQVLQPSPETIKQQQITTSVFQDFSLLPLGGGLIVTECWFQFML